MKVRTSLTLALAIAIAACGAPPPQADLGTWTPSGAPAGATSGSSGAGIAVDDGGNPGTGSSSGGSSSGTSSGSGSTGVDAGNVLPPPRAGGGAAGGLPCDVATVFASKCISCHSNPPINGSLSSLVSYSDLTATAKEDPTQNEAQLSLSRMQNTASPMPPAALNTPATAADISTVQAWIAGGYPMGTCGGDGGTAVDAGPAVVVVDVFSGRPAFKATTGPSAHNAGQDCMGCHTTGGGEAPRFLFGGTAYDGSGNPVAGAEIRVVDANGTGYSVYSGTNGNFYQTGGGLAVPGHAGARNAAGSALMVSNVTKPGCNSCHCTGASCVTGRIHIP